MSNTFEIRKEVAVPVAIEVLWHAVATPAGQAGWSPDPYAVSDEHTVEQDKPHRFCVQTPSDEHGAFHRFEYLLQPADDGSTLTFVHSGDLGDTWQAPFDFEVMTSHGWDIYMHNLQQYLTHFPARNAVFITGQAPQQAASAEAWGQLERALGLQNSVDELHVGDKVELAPQGLSTIAGVIDYVQPGEGFLAVRGEHGLYRFHSMRRMGMPITFGHYLFAPTEERAEQLQQEQQNWQDWLADLFAA